MIKIGKSNQKTVGLAEESFGYMKAFAQPADPKSYGVWYAVAAGDNGLLRQAVDKLIKSKGTPSPKDIENLYNTHISSAHISEKIDQLGLRVLGEIEHVVTTIETAQGTATNYRKNINDISERLDVANDREGTRSIVENLINATRLMETKNLALRGQLNSVLQEVAELRGALNAARKDSLTDTLTSLGNRKYFHQTLTAIIEQCHERKDPLSLLMVDIDHFKRVNDTYGHVIGDRVLRFVALALERNIKGQDIVARYGDDQFAVILPQTRLSAAIRIAQQMRVGLMNRDLLRHLVNEKKSPLTISVGVASLDRGGIAQALVEAANICLYAAKRCGLNRVVAETDEELLEAVTMKTTG